MDGLPDKFTFGVGEVARIMGVSAGTVYELVRTGQLKHIPLGNRKIITRQALAEFLQVDEVPAEVVKGRRAQAGKKEEVTEWTYVVTVKRIKTTETVRVEPKLSSWGRT